MIIDLISPPKASSVRDFHRGAKKMTVGWKLGVYFFIMTAGTYAWMHHVVPLVLSLDDHTGYHGDASYVSFSTGARLINPMSATGAYLSCTLRFGSGGRLLLGDYEACMKKYSLKGFTAEELSP